MSDVDPAGLPATAPQGRGPHGGLGILLGLILTAVLHIAMGVLVWIGLGVALGLTSGRETGGYAGLFFLMAIGLAQLLYMVPAVLLARRAGRRTLAKGLTIGAALTFLLNATCWLIVVGK